MIDFESALSKEETIPTVEETTLPAASAPVEPAPVETVPSVEAPASAAPIEPDPVSPVEVISVEELLGLLQNEAGEEVPEETAAPEETETPEETTSLEDSTPTFSDIGPIEVVGMQEALTRLKTIETQTKLRPMLTTSFQNYTVAEGLLLLLLLCAFVAACVKMLKGGFSWLR